MVFHGGYGSVHCQREDEARHGASLGQSPFHGVGDDITVIVFARELVPRLEEDGAPLPYVFVLGFDLALFGSPFECAGGVFHIDTGHGGVSVDGDVGRDDFVEQLWAMFHPHSKLVRAGNAAHFLGEEFGSGLADQLPDDLSDGKGTDSAIGFGGGDHSRREVCAEDLCRKVSSGESPKGFPSNSVIQVQCSYLPPPGPAALLEGENLMASKSW